jgi:hypothetical protein
MGKRRAVAPRADRYRGATSSLPGWPRKEIKMQKIRLLQTACAVAMLAAVPAFAQSNTPPAAAGNAGMPDTASHRATPGSPSMSDSKDSMAPARKSANKMGMAPGEKDAQGGAADAESHSTHRSAMNHRTGMGRSGKSVETQNSAIDNLNDQSYAAAQKGEAFSGPGSSNGSDGMNRPAGSGQMNDMGGGSMSGGASTGNAPAGGAPKQ